jgi:hypothetical protein
MPKIKINRSKIEQTQKRNNKWKNNFFKMANNVKIENNKPKHKKITEFSIEDETLYRL